MRTFEVSCAGPVCYTLLAIPQKSAEWNGGGITKNSDYVIYVTSSRGRTWKWFRDETGWKQVGPEGQTHHPTAEQVLNHLLPACANIKPVTLKVVYRGPYKCPHKKK